MKKHSIPYLVFMLVLLVGLIVLMIVSTTTNAVEVANAEPEIVGYLRIPAKRLPEQKQEKEVKVLSREEKFELKMARWLAAKAAKKEQLNPEPVMEYIGRFRITGYDTCSRCCGKSDGITASGTQATVGRTCAAPASIPFGTVLYIDGIGERVVEDRGGFASNVIDVLCEDHAQCYAITGWYEVYKVVEP